jgi:hypothetical protein
MNKQALVIALGWALQTLTVQAAEPIIQPSDRPKPNAVQTAPRAKSNTDDRRATAATARRTGIEQGKVREIIEPEDRTGMTRRDKPAPRSIIEPQDRPRGIVQPQDRPRGGVQPQDRPAKIIDPEAVPRQLMGPGHRSGLGKPTTSRLIEGGSVGAPNFTVGDATALRSGAETGKVREIIEPTDRAQRKPRANSGQRSVIEPQDFPRKIIEPADRPTQIIQPEDRPAKAIEPEDVPRQLMGPGHRSGLIKPTNRPRRDNEKTTPLLPRRPIEDSSVGVPEFTVGDAKAAARERWRALAEEFAFGYLGNFVTKLARRTGEDFEGPALDLHSCAGPVTPDNRCVASPITRRDR